MKTNCFRTHPGLTASPGNEENDGSDIADNVRI